MPSNTRTTAPGNIAIKHVSQAVSLTGLTLTSLTIASLILCATTTAATINVTELEPGDLFITEYLADPVGVSDSAAEYFEIFNRLEDSIDLSGLEIRDDGVNSMTVSSLIIAPGAFAVFSSSDGSALGITPDYVYGGSMSLTNTDDEIGLFRPDNTLIHKVVYTDGDFFGDGISHELGVAGLATPSIVTGPAAGFDFVAGSLILPLGNFGSPGSAGNTLPGLSVVPIPGAFWLFGSALALLYRIRRIACNHARPREAMRPLIC
jgi:hypothetical protein